MGFFCLSKLCVLLTVSTILFCEWSIADQDDLSDTDMFTFNETEITEANSTNTGGRRDGGFVGGIIDIIINRRARRNDNSTSDGNDALEQNPSDKGDNSTSRGERRRNKRNLKFTWRQIIGGQATITKSFTAQSGSKQVKIESKDKNLSRYGYSSSTVTYDFETGSCVVAIKTKGKGPCYVTDDTITYEEIVDGATQLEGKLSPNSVELTMYGTQQPLTRKAKSELFINNPQLQTACGRGDIIMLAAPEAITPTSGSTKQIKVLTYDAALTIIAPGGRRG